MREARTSLTLVPQAQLLSTCLRVYGQGSRIAGIAKRRGCCCVYVYVCVVYLQAMSSCTSRV